MPFRRTSGFSFKLCAGIQLLKGSKLVAHEMSSLRNNSSTFASSQIYITTHTHLLLLVAQLESTVNRFEGFASVSEKYWHLSSRTLNLVYK